MLSKYFSSHLLSGTHKICLFMSQPKNLTSLKKLHVFKPNECTCNLELKSVILSSAAFNVMMLL